MIRVRNADDRGFADHGWLQARHTFSFAEYRDPQHVGFRSLRVMNEDRVAPGQGFGTHPHRDMEIVTYLLDGQLAHKDSMGHGETLKPGEFQRITAGTGILHSEFNPSDSEYTHLYQIWLLPERRGIEPSYEQKSFDAALRKNRLQLVASPDGAEDSLHIHQDARIYLADLDDGRELELQLGQDRHAWIQVLRGQVQSQTGTLGAGDGLAVSDESRVTLRGEGSAELMIFDLA